jgi:hypothetical protein
MLAHGHRIPRSTSVTIAIRPSCGHGTAGIPKDDLPDGESEKFLDEGVDKCERGVGVICPSGKSLRAMALCKFLIFGKILTLLAQLSERSDRTFRTAAVRIPSLESRHCMVQP